jgi:carboxymethylenebutenolidase
MCHELDSLPPIAPIAGAAVDTEDLVLTAADGNRFAAFAARSAAPSGAGIVVLPDVRGLYRFYEELAMRFAEEGVNAVAIDYFGRTAGISKRGDDFAYMDEVANTTVPGVNADTAAAVAYLRSPQGGSCRSVYTVGFCFGGSNSWIQASAGHGLAGAIGFYGHPGRAQRDGSPSVTERAGDMTCPILGLMGGADQGIPPEVVDDYRRALDKAGVKNEIVTYAGAPHSFFDRTYEQHADACADAWRRVLAFIRSNHQ